MRASSSIGRAIGVGLILAACHTEYDGEPEPEPRPEEVAEEVSDHLALTRGLLEEVLAIATGRSARPPAGDEDDWALGAWSSRNVDYAVECRDAAGAPVECGEEAEAARSRLSLASWRDQPSLYLEHEWESEWSLAGLRSDGPVVDGAGAFGEAQEIPWNPFNDAAFSGSVELRATLDGLRWSPEGATFAGGVLAYEYVETSTTETEDGASESTDEATASVTIVETGVARIVVDGLHAFRFDLATEELSPEP